MTRMRRNRTFTPPPEKERGSNFAGECQFPPIAGWLEHCRSARRLSPPTASASRQVQRTLQLTRQHRVGDPSPDQQPRLGRDNRTRCLRQRPPPGADPVTTATTAPSTRRVIRDLDDLKQAVMAAYEADQTASVDEL